MAEPQTVAIVTLPGFNEIDSFVAARMIDSVSGLQIELVGPDDTAVSMAGVRVETPGDWSDLVGHAGVILGSGIRTFEHIENSQLMDAIARNLRPGQLLGSQCSGAAILHRLGQVDGLALCTDKMTAPRLEALGVEVLVEPFRADGTIASSGGCLSSTYLAYWMIDRLAGRDAADVALSKVVPVGEEAAYQTRVDALISSAPAS